VTSKTDPIHAQLVDARRNQILDAATKVFADKGFHLATIRDIARTAGIADGTIYNYFKNKPDLMLGILNRLNETERRAVDLAQGIGGEVSVRSFFAGYLRHRLAVLDANLATFQAVLPDLLTNSELRERYLREVLEPSLRLAEPLFEQWIAIGALRRVDAALAMRTVPSLVLGLMVMRMLGDRTIEQRWAELPEFLTGLIFDGLKKEECR